MLNFIMKPTKQADSHSQHKYGNDLWLPSQEISCGHFSPDSLQPHPSGCFAPPPFFISEFFVFLSQTLRRNITPHTHTPQIPPPLMEKCSDYFVVLISANTCAQGQGLTFYPKWFTPTPSLARVKPLVSDSNYCGADESAENPPPLLFVGSVPTLGTSLAFLTALFLGPLPFATGPLVLILYPLWQYHLFDYFSPAITSPKQKWQ